MSQQHNNNARIAPYDLSQRPKNGETVRQPMNPFLIWCKTKRGELLKAQQGARPCDISKQLGELWRNMSEEEKQPFVEEAKVLKEEHQKNHPDFKRKHRKKATHQNSSSSSNSTPKTNGTHTTTTSSSSTSTFNPPPPPRPQIRSPDIQNHQYYNIPLAPPPTTQGATFTAHFVPTNTQHLGYQYTNFAPGTLNSAQNNIGNSMIARDLAERGTTTTSASSQLPFFY